MKNQASWLIAAAVVLLLAGAPVFGQDEPAGPAGGEPPAEAPQTEAPGPGQAESAQPVTGLEQQGEFVAVDTEQSFFLILGENGQEMLFHYDDQTEMGGEIGRVQGLAGQSGARLRIEYRAEGDRAIAERIEIVAPGGDTGAQPEAQPDTN